MNLNIVNDSKLDQLVSDVSKIYCPHTIKIHKVNVARQPELGITPLGQNSLVHLSYAAQLTIDAENFENLFLVLNAKNGVANTSQDSERVRFHQGQSVIFSSERCTTLEFNKEFSQASLTLDNSMIEQVCSRWVGSSLNTKLKFKLTPFQPSFQQQWNKAIKFSEDMIGNNTPLANNAIRAYEEYLITLLLQYQPHNYSALLQKSDTNPRPNIVKQAEQLIRDTYQAPITITELASELNVSARTLQATFKHSLGVTPKGYLTKVRLERVHDELSASGTCTTVTQAAFNAGFCHMGRFSEAYKKQFGELPIVTLRRNSQ
ncbi:AraC family transcriptional regulator [Vibrio penaeicida]|uniref:AraC family transcriptional regulator n=1 Tax=Vibrio penaeicida TaxID=104609 RepID=A0AAV5NNM3_9VIBR|nr:AraC family transcriptional regulator [Vibrio penaeicida]RTZ22001.1 AraC family transcriptional regulator [Vibrio penaeicida]GLQ71802.1 AraC family transcriptional regulator [Vibrio penaeicida]